MAKKKQSKPIEPDVLEEVIAVEEAEPETAEVVEEPSLDEIATEVVEEKVEPKKNSIDQFIHTQLKVLNRKPNQARARRQAERILKHRKGN